VPRYILYARKSSESEDRQVLSIDSQVRELTQHAQSQGLDVVQVFSESRSAKSPGRPIFADVLALIAKGKADGIVCWKLDRLARNPVDGGALIWAVDEGKIREIVTRDRTFTNTGNDKFWMQLEFGMAKKYVDDLSDNVKRGNRAKLAGGWLPGVPPVGYLNDLAMKTIISDPERFALVRKMWRLVLSGRPPMEVLAEANETWGLRTRRSRRQGGVSLSRSTFYKMLSNPFYYGLIVRNGETHQGAHEPMISREEFDRVQELLGRLNRPRYERHHFAFTGLMRCGECGCAVTPSKSTSRSGARYLYYYCTRRQNGVTCSQRMTRADAIDSQITDALGRIRISDRFHAWAVKRLDYVHGEEIKARQATGQALDHAYRDAERQIDALVQMRLRGLLTDEEYLRRKEALTAEALRLKERLADTDSRRARWYKLAERSIYFAESAQNRFVSGSSDEKRDILVALGTKFLLKDRKLRIELQEPFRLMEGAGSRSSWLGIVDGIQRFFKEHPTHIQWPAFCRNEDDDEVVTTRPSSVNPVRSSTAGRA